MTSLEPTTVSATTQRQAKRAAVMIADMVAYSRRMEQDQVSSVGHVTRSIQLFRALIGDYGGEITNLSGDGILALFDDADKALQFAAQIQTEFRDQSVWGDGEPIQFRIGLNVGEVTFHESVAYGHCINVAARLQAMADPGGILVTGAFKAAAGEAPGLKLHSLGQPRLKNISESIEVFAVEQIGAGSEPFAIVERSAPKVDSVGQPAIAVLALSNLSGDPSNDHLCEGIAEDIIGNLARFRNLMVIARHSAFLFNLKDHRPEEVRQRLGVRYILTGSLRRADKRLRVAVQLIDAASESTLWSDRLNVELDDLFELQDEIAGAVAARMSVQIDIAEQRHGSHYPQDMRAYGLVLRGGQLLLKFTRESNRHARRLYEEAIEIAPDYSRAYSAQSKTYNHDWRYAWSTSPKDSLEAAIGLARRAKSLDRLDARGFAELGYAMLYSKQLDEALTEYVQALELNPNDSDIITEYGDALNYSGQPERAVELFHKAMRLNPHFPDWYLWCLADAYDTMGRHEDVIASVKRMHDPSEGQRLLAANYAHLGMMNEARQAVREVLRLQPHFSIRQWGERVPHRDRVALERFVEGLRKAGLPD